MTRHRFDVFAMFFGIAFAATATAFLLDELRGSSFDPLWVVAAGLLTLGAVAIIGAVASVSRRDDPATVAPTATSRVSVEPSVEPAGLDDSAGDERVDDTVER